MAGTFDRDRAAKIVDSYLPDADQDTRDALLGQLEPTILDDKRVSAINNLVDAEIESNGIYNGTVLFAIYGVLQGGLPIPGLLPVEVAPVEGRTTREQVTVSVQGVPAVLGKDEAQQLIDTLQQAVTDATDNAETRRAELRKMTKSANEKRPADAADNGTDSA